MAMRSWYINQISTLSLWQICTPNYHKSMPKNQLNPMVSRMPPTEAFSNKQPMVRVAAIFGVTGLVGRELARKLVSDPTWKVYGIARKPPRSPIQSNNYQFISCDLMDPLEIRNKLSSLSDVTHVFWVTWSPQFPIDSPECYEQNKSILSNAMDTILTRAKGRLKHVSIQTGTKHYVSINDMCLEPKREGIVYYDEECPRVVSPGVHNFYYGLEDELKEKLAASKVAWSVQRPGLILGSSDRTWYNLMGTIGVYGSICKRLNLPLVFGGTRECWEEPYLDMSDARLVAEQHIWASTNEGIASEEGEAFNAINGGSYTWKEVWPAIGRKFGIEMGEEEEMCKGEYLYWKEMGDKGEVWREIAEREGLVSGEMERLANWGFMDVLFRCPVKMLCSREKADGLGFTKRCSAMESMLYWIDAMREEKLIP